MQSEQWGKMTEQIQQLEDLKLYKYNKSVQNLPETASKIIVFQT